MAYLPLPFLSLAASASQWEGFAFMCAVCLMFVLFVFIKAPVFMVGAFVAVIGYVWHNKQRSRTASFDTSFQRKSGTKGTGKLKGDPQIFLIVGGVLIAFVGLIKDGDKVASASADQAREVVLSLGGQPSNIPRSSH